jgi:hypothetical protein
LLQALQRWLSWHRSSALLLSQLQQPLPTPFQLMLKPSSSPSSNPISSVRERIMATTLMLTTTARSSTSACQLKMTLVQLLKLLTGASSVATRPSLTRPLLLATMRLMLFLVLKHQPFMVLLSLERLMLKFSKSETVSSLSEYGDRNQNCKDFNLLCYYFFCTHFLFFLTFLCQINVNQNKLIEIQWKLLKLSWLMLSAAYCDQIA